MYNTIYKNRMTGILCINSRFDHIELYYLFHRFNTFVGANMVVGFTTTIAIDAYHH